MPYHRLALLTLICLGVSVLVSCAAPPAAQAPPAALPAPAIPSSTSLAASVTAPPSPTASPSVHQPAAPPASCPITRPPPVTFVPPSPYEPRPPERYMGAFWYGSPELWTMLDLSGTWYGLPHSAAGYSQKVFWWRQGYSMNAEPISALTVTGKRLDASAPLLEAKGATNASADFGEAMLIGVDIPTLGCWEITGHYLGHELSFVIWVEP